MSPNVSGLERLLNPRSIAVIGGKEAERVVEHPVRGLAQRAENARPHAA